MAASSLISFVVSAPVTWDNATHGSWKPRSRQPRKVSKPMRPDRETRVNPFSLVTLSNSAGQAEDWPLLAKELCQRLGYDKVTAMTSGSEATDAACKLARGWGVRVKKINPRDVLVLGTSENFHGFISGVWTLMEPGAGWKGWCSRHPAFRLLRLTNG